MTSSLRFRPVLRRRWFLTVAVVVLAALVAVWAGGPVAAWVLESRLRDAGWREAAVVGSSLSFNEMAFERVTLIADGALIAEDVRARLAPGVEQVSIGRLRVRAALTADGEFIVPGAPEFSEGASAGAALPFHFMPPDGVTVEHAELVIGTPFGEVGMRLSDVASVRTAGGARLRGIYEAFDNHGGAFTFTSQVSLEVGDEGEWLATLRVDDGHIAAGGLRASDFAGDLNFVVGGGQAPNLQLAAVINALQYDNADLGALVIDAAWADGTGELRAETRGAPVIEGSVHARLGSTTDTRTVRLEGRLASLPTPGSDATNAMVTFDADLAAPLEARSAAEIRDALSGSLQVRARNAVLPGVFTQGAVDVSAQLQGEPNGWRLSFSESKAEVRPDKNFPLTQFAFPATEPLAVMLHPNADQPPLLRISFAEPAALFDGRIEVAGGDVRIDTAMQATVSLGARTAALARADWNVDAALSTFTLRNLRWRDMLLGIDAFAGRVKYAADGLQIDGAGKLRTDGDWASIHVDGVVADWTGQMTYTGNEIQLTASDCIKWNVHELVVEGLRIAEASLPCVAAGDGPLLRLDLTRGRTAFAFALADQPLSASVKTNTEGATDSEPSTDSDVSMISGVWPQITAVGELSAGGMKTLSLRFSGGALSSSRHQLAAGGIEGTVDWQNGSLATSTLRIASLESLATPAWLAPLTIETRVFAEGDTVAFEASASDTFGTFVLDASGRHLAKRTSAALRLYPVRFVPGAVEIADLSPRLAELVSDATGLVEFEGRVERGPSGLISEGTLTLDAVSARFSGVPIEGLHSDVRFASLIPPVTPPEQRLTIERVDLGMPLENGVAVFALAEDGALDIDQLEFAFAGGRLFGEPFTIDSAHTDDIGLVLRAEDVELDSFLALSQINGLAGSGTLAGRVPIRLSSGRIQLDDGVLAAETDGVLRYSPDDLPDFLRGDDVRSQMLREVLTNFHYDELSLAVSGDSGEGGAQQLTLNARGSNPDFLDGHPIELGFNFTGPLLGAVRSAVELTGAQESGAQALEERFQQDLEDEENSR